MSGFAEPSKQKVERRAQTRLFTIMAHSAVKKGIGKRVLEDQDCGTRLCLPNFRFSILILSDVSTVITL